MVRIKVLILLFLLSFTLGTKGFSAERPEIWGVAKMTFQVDDFSLVRAYYGEYLGFEEAFSYQSVRGQVISFKVNDRQFIEFVENKGMEKKCSLISVSFDCDKISQMEAFLRSKGVDITTPTSYDNAGNERVTIRGTEEYDIEFICFKSEGLHKSTKGQFLGESRIAQRLHHAGLYVSDIDEADALFVEILGFKEMWRYKDDNTSMPNFIYLHPVSSIENIEYVVKKNPNSSHPCFCVPEMQETIYTLKERDLDFELARPIIGKGNRWLLNISNGKGIRVEFTEAYTVK